MKAEIISIGDELLIGQVVNTNASWMASELSLLGVEVVQIVAIADKKQDILNVISRRSASLRNNLKLSITTYREQIFRQYRGAESFVPPLYFPVCFKLQPFDYEGILFYLKNILYTYLVLWQLHHLLVAFFQ